MARHLRIEFPGAVYNVTSKGLDGTTVFIDDRDRTLFLEIVSRAVERWGWIIHGYCLMGNHYHLLVETPEANLSRGMRQINGEYTQVFNRRHKRAGKLFQGRFKSILVEKESHLPEVARYIVLLPMADERFKVRKLEEWSWSSYNSTAGITDTPPWLDVSWILSRFGGNSKKARQGYKKFIGDGLKGKPAIYVHRGLWIGSEDFGNKIENQRVRKEETLRYRGKEKAAKGKTLKQYFPANARKKKESRNKAVYKAYSEGRFTQKEIGDYLGLNHVTISRIVRTLEREVR